MLTSRLFLRRPPRIRLFKPLYGTRFQHGQNGPHREYFQNPSQYPSNFEPSKLPSDLLTPTQPLTADVRPSLFRRALRTTSLALVCYLLGVLGGTAIVTYEYMAPPFERGTEEYQELQEEIEEILDTSPVVEELREQGWFEEPVVPSKTMHVPGDRHLVQDTLTGVQGLTMKQFRHPDQQTASAVVFFAGFGLEGWPDYLHGGAIMSMFKQAYDRHLTPLIKNEGLTLAFNADEDIEAAFDVNSFTFHKPVRPGEIYTVFVFSQGFGTSYNTKTGSSMMVDSAQLILTPGDFMPDIAFHPERVDVNVPENVIHATCLVRVMLDTDRVSKDELGDKRLEQLTAEAKRISEKYESSHKAMTPRSAADFGRDGG